MKKLIRIHILKELESDLLRSRKLSLSEYFKLLKFLPKLFRQIISSLGDITTKLELMESELKSLAKPVPQKSFPPLLVDEINRFIGGDKFVCILPSKYVSDLRNFFGDCKHELVFVQTNKVLTHVDDCTGIIYLNEISTTFRENNRFYVESGRITELLLEEGGLITYLKDGRKHPSVCRSNDSDFLTEVSIRASVV